MHRLYVLLFLLTACSPAPTPPSDTVSSKSNRSTAVPNDSFPNQEAVPTPPLPDYDTTRWTDIGRLIPGIALDLRYATTDNFVDEKLYPCARCFLRPKAAAALLDIHTQLQHKGLGLQLFDCYRPASVQQRLWEKVPDATYVTPPAKGSMHNRGLAVDLTLVDSNGVALDMGTPFDFFGRKAHHTHTDLPEEVLTNRRLLKSTMESNGFKSIRTEWWHYSYVGGGYGLADMIWKCDEENKNGPE